MAQKVDVQIQTVNGLVTVNEWLAGLLTEVFGLVGAKGKETVKIGNGCNNYVC